MKKFTYGDGCAIMILVAQRMGLAPKHADDAVRQLEGAAILPTTSASMEKEAVGINDRLCHDGSLIAQANIHAQQMMAVYGFTFESPVIVSAVIGPMPRPMPQGMFDEMPSVTAVFSNGHSEKLFSFYPDEISFTEQEFVGLTRAQALKMRQQRDVSFLRDRA